VERADRANRWAYDGLHGLDFAVLYRARPLWDVVAIVLLAGVLASGVTSAMPAFRRLARHARRVSSGINRPSTVRSDRSPAPAPVRDPERASVRVVPERQRGQSAPGFRLERLTQREVVGPGEPGSVDDEPMVDSAKRFGREPARSPAIARRTPYHPRRPPP
jgi:hypothetical protein